MEKVNIISSKDGKVIFDKEKYFFKRLEGDLKLYSVTGIIKKLTHPFDVEVKSAQVAAKTGVSAEEVKLLWKGNNKAKSDLGSLLHKYIERRHYGEVVNIDFPIEEVAEQFIDDFYIKERLFNVSSEMLVYSDNYAGFIDNVSKTKDNKTVIIDYKTNEVFNDTYYDTFKPPFNQVGCSKLAKATIQLNLLKRAFENNTGTTVDFMYVLHITEEGYKFMKINDITNDIEFKSLVSGDFRRIEVIVNG